MTDQQRRTLLSGGAQIHTCTAPTRSRYHWCGGRTRRECELHMEACPAPPGFRRSIFSCPDGSHGVSISPDYSRGMRISNVQ